MPPSLRRGEAEPLRSERRDTCGDTILDVHVEVRLLGGFTVLVDGTPTPASRWSRRHASALVKLLALSPGGRLHRDRVVDALWPDLTLDAALPRLHKAAHYARGALGDRDAVVLRGEVVALFPGATLEVDALEFEAAAEAALAAEPVSPEECAVPCRLAVTCFPKTLPSPGWRNPVNCCGFASRACFVAHAAGRTCCGWTRRTRRHMSSCCGRRLPPATGRPRCAATPGWSESSGPELGISPGPEAIALRERLLAADAGRSGPRAGGRSLGRAKPSCWNVMRNSRN